MKNILIVEDDNLTIDYLLNILHPEGYNVITAANEFDALDILSDSNMEIHFILAATNQDSQHVGGHLLKNVKMMRKYARTPFIFMTSKADYEHLQEAIVLGADDVIVKPFDARMLLAKLDILQNGLRHFVVSQKKVKNKARFEDTLNIISISDLGLTLSMPFEVKEGSKIKISSDLFKEVGIDNPYLHVVRVRPSETADDSFIVEATFLVETNDMAVKLRKWLQRYSKRALIPSLNL